MKKAIHLFLAFRTMGRPGKNRTIRTAYKIHSLVGLATGFFVFILAVTGAMLVFKQEINNLFLEEIPIKAGERKPLSVDQLTKKLQEQYGNIAFTYIKYPINSYGNRDYSYPYAVSAELENGEKEYWKVNPYSAAVLPEPAFDIGQIIRDIHVRLFVGKWLKVRWFDYTLLIFVGVVGLTLTISIITGAIVLSRRFLRDLLKFRRPGNFGILTSELHKKIALWALLFHIVIAATGAFLGLEPIYWLTNRNDNNEKTEVSREERKIENYHKFEKLAVQAIPDAVPIAISHPEYRDDPLRVILRNNSPWIHWGSSNVEMEPDTGKVRKVNNAAEAGFWKRIYYIIEPFHFGYFGGLTVKIIYSLGSVLLGILPLTGYIIWYRRRK